jgi:hypothetical protein
MLKGAEERLKNAEERLRSFIDRPDRQYSSEDKAENKRLLDVFRVAMVEYSGIDTKQVDWPIVGSVQDNCGAKSRVTVPR